MSGYRPGRERLAYSTEVFDRPDGSLIEVLARVNDLDMARAAHLVACQQRPDQHIVLALKTQAPKAQAWVFRSVSSSSSLRTWPGVSRSAYAA